MHCIFFYTTLILPVIVEFLNFLRFFVYLFIRFQPFCTKPCRPRGNFFFITPYYYIKYRFFSFLYAPGMTNADHSVSTQNLKKEKTYECCNRKE